MECRKNGCGQRRIIWREGYHELQRTETSGVRVMCRSGLQRVVWGKKCNDCYDFIGAVICVRCRRIDLSLAVLDRVRGENAVMTWSICHAALLWISLEWVLWAPILGFPNRLSDQKCIGWLAQHRFLTIQFESDQVCNGHGQEANHKRASETVASVTCVVAERKGAERSKKTRSENRRKKYQKNC